MAKKLPAGIEWDSARSKYRVSVYVNGKRYRLGRFDTLTDAKAAKLTSLSVWTIRRRIADGQIRNCRRSGNRILIPIDQLERIGRPMATAQSLRGSAA